MSNAIAVCETITRVSSRVSTFGRASNDYTAIWGGHRLYGTFAVNHPNIDANHVNNVRYMINGPRNIVGMTGVTVTEDDVRVHVAVTSSLHPGGPRAAGGWVGEVPLGKSRQEHLFSPHANSRWGNRRRILTSWIVWTKCVKRVLNFPPKCVSVCHNF